MGEKSLMNTFHQPIQRRRHRLRVGGWEAYGGQIGGEEGRGAREVGDVGWPKAVLLRGADSGKAGVTTWEA